MQDALWKKRQARKKGLSDALHEEDNLFMLISLNGFI